MMILNYSHQSIRKKMNKITATKIILNNAVIKTLRSLSISPKPNS